MPPLPTPTHAAINGSVLSGSALSGFWDDGMANSNEDQAEESSETLRQLRLEEPSASYFSVWSSSSVAVEERSTRMRSYLDDFDKYFLGHGGPTPQLSQFQVFPAHTRLPGEQPPFRVEDGVSTTQPRRGRRRRTQSSTALTPVDGEEATSDLTPHPQRSNDQAPALSPSSEVFSTVYAADPFWLDPSKTWVPDAANETASFQHFDQQSQMSPDKSWRAPLDISSSAYLFEITLSNRLGWDPYQGLFAQNQQHHPPPTPPNPYIPGSIENSPYPNGHPYRPVMVSLGSQFEAEPVLLLSLEPSRIRSPQDSSPNRDSSLPSLPFHSSSSQATSSPLDLSNIHSPPFVGGQGGEQGEGLLIRSQVGGAGARCAIFWG